MPKPIPRNGREVKDTCCGSCFRCFVTLGILAVIAAGGIYAAIYFTDAEKPSDLLNATFYPGSDWIPTVEDFTNEDPFNATTPEGANKWRGFTDGRGGLTLEVVNALEDRWFPFLDQSVKDWENGNPDVLTLTVTMNPTGPDPDCSAIQGKIKVCNNNYGSTGWKGLNVVELLGDEIISSAAKMNEYYLANSNDGKKQYTMCHELGHGFGLPHTDENFNNEDTGECMDYTDTPAANASPGPRNFEFLREMYGTTGNNGGSNMGFSNRLRGLQNNKEQRDSRNAATLSSSAAAAANTRLPRRLRKEINMAVKEFEQELVSADAIEWEEKHRNDFVTVHSRNFGGLNGESYRVQVTKYLVRENEQV